MLCDGMCKLPTLSLLQSVPVCAVCMVHNNCAALSIPRSPLYTIQVTCYSCVCSFVTAKSLPLNPVQHPLPHLPIPHLPLYTALIHTAHSPHTLTTHVLHMWHCVTLVHAVCESPSLPPVHSTLHQSLSSPRLTCSRERCIRSTRGSK